MNMLSASQKKQLSCRYTTSLDHKSYQNVTLQMYTVHNVSI